jgi:hypothetical protein
MSKRATGSLFISDQAMAECWLTSAGKAATDSEPLMYGSMSLHERITEEQNQENIKKKT